MIKNILIFFFWFYHNNHTAPTHSQQFQTSHKYTNSPTFSNHNAQDKSPKFSPPLFHSPSFPPPFPPHYQRSFSKTVRYPQLNNSQSIFPFTTLPPIIVSAWIVGQNNQHSLFPRPRGTCINNLYVPPIYNSHICIYPRLQNGICKPCIIAEGALLSGSYAQISST